MGGFTLPMLPDLLAASNLSFADLGNWQPPDSASGPQNNNVIQYSKVAGAGCDPMKGCPSTPSTNPAPTTQSKSIFDTILDNLPGAPPITMDQMRANVKAGVPATTGMAPSLSVGRIAAFLLGLICIAGGIFLFGTAQFENPTVQKIVGAAAIV